MAIEAPRYQEARDKLKKNPIVQRYADELKGTGSALTGSDGKTPTFSFMQAANRRFVDDCKKEGLNLQLDKHIGAVAEAVLELMAEKEVKGE